MYQELVAGRLADAKSAIAVGNAIVSTDGYDNCQVTRKLLHVCKLS